MIVDQMCAIDSQLSRFHLSKGTVMGMSFHLKNLSEEIRLGHSSRAVEVFKGELSDEEVVSYLTILNKGEEKRGLSLILEDKEKIESVSRDENLWIQLKETTGFQPGGLINILDKVGKTESMDDIDYRGEIKMICQERYEEVFEKVKDLLGIYFHEEIKDRFKGFENASKFMNLSFQSYHNKIPINHLLHEMYCDYRFVVCDDLQKTRDRFEGFPLTNPRALSKPVADAMFQVYLL